MTVLKHVLVGATVLVCATVQTTGVASAPQTPPAIPSIPVVPLPADLTKTIGPVVSAVWSGFDLKAAMGHVQFVGGYWRLPGNPGYEAAIDRVHARLETAQPGSAKTTLSIESYPNTSKGWDYTAGTLAIVHGSGAEEVVLSRENQHIALCINSFSTAPGGVTIPIVDVGRGATDADFAGKDVKGAVVIGDNDTNQLWRRAVTAHGAVGVISTALGEYISPVAPGVTAPPHDTWNVLQWGSVPYDEAVHGFGFKATPKAAATIRKALAAGPVKVHVTIASTFSTKPIRTLVAEIPGRVAPEERVVIAVHVQEPGANDNASGVATLTEMVMSLTAAIRSGKVPPPARTITFLWLDEIAGSRQWLKDHADVVKGVKYMFSMDMTGEDVKKTGGSFLIERWPDPGAVWDRPWDPHSEWGRGDVREGSLKGDLLNDLHLAICRLVARRSGWVVSTNPYEGGSDHTVFGSAGIPSVLDWHFTDRYYHSNLDTPDKTSATEMRNVGTAVAATAWLLASAREQTTLSVAEFVEKAGRSRIQFEEREGAKLAAAAPDRAAAALAQDRIVQAWKKWYAEAVRSVSRLIVGTPTAKFGERVDGMARGITDDASKTNN